MSLMKNAIMEILECEFCYGQGMTGWTSPDGDFDFEYCECNPHSLIIDKDTKSLMLGVAV